MIPTDEIKQTIEEAKTELATLPRPEVKQEILDALDRPDLISTYAEQGIFKNVLWYGFKLDDTDAYILSDGRLLRCYQECPSCGNRHYLNTRKSITRCACGRKGAFFHKNELTEQLGVRVQNSLGMIAPFISKTAVKQFLANPAIDVTKIYSAVRDRILYFMDFGEQDEVADVLTCWIIGTYVFQIFHWFPHILFNAPSTSGKSKCAIIVLKLSFNGYDLGASGGVSAPQMFRTIEENRGTLLLDEFERGDKFNESYRLLMQVFNSSPSRDSYIIRLVQDDKKWTSQKFPIFCPKIVANITGVNPTSLSRFIPFSWLKTSNAVKSKRKPEKFSEAQPFEELKQGLYLLALNHWPKIRNIYDDLDIAELVSRDSDNWLPLFAVARFVESQGARGIESQLMKYCKSYKALEVETGDVTREFFLILQEVISLADVDYTPAELALKEGIIELLSSFKSPASWIGRTLKNYKFKQKRIRGTRVYTLSYERVKIIINLYFKTEIVSPTDTPDLSDQGVHSDTQIKDRVSQGDTMYTYTGGGICQKRTQSVLDLVVSLKNSQGLTATQTVADAFGPGFEEALALALAKGEVYEPKLGWLAVLS